MTTRCDLLDTGPAQSYVHRRGNVFSVASERSLAGCRIGTSMPVVGELFFGVEASETKDKNLRRLLHELDDFVLWPLDKIAARKFGELAAYLKHAGRVLSAVDIQTAAIVLTLGNCTLVTADADFQAIPGLTIENWA